MLSAAHFLGCGGNGHHVQADSGGIILREPHEIQAQALLHRTIARAEKLVDDPRISDPDRARLRQTTRAARDALSRYSELRKRGRARTQVMSAITAASLALIADDVTGVGVANDVGLLPLALAAMSAHIVMTAPASSDELARAWTRVGQTTQELANAVDSALSFAAPGRWADTGIMGEVYRLIDDMGFRRDDDDDVCRALAILLQAAKDAGDKKKAMRIRTTQKVRDCRGSRHNRE